ncbi:MAG TPA: hypothetical protein VMU10_01875, partial [Desulfomonilia bacterium]|nr:hypothetical protein [Desulfomonilia bacterium]
RIHTVLILKELRTYVQNTHNGTIIRLLRTVPGVGFISAIILFTEIMAGSRGAFFLGSFLLAPKERNNKNK